MSSLRNRKPVADKTDGSTNNVKEEEVKAKLGPPVEDNDKNAVVDLELLRGSYWLTRVVFLRYLAFIYIVAFVVALHQNKQLIGKHGLLPADFYLDMIRNHFGNNNKQLFKAFLTIPTMLLFTNSAHIDWWLDSLAIFGLFLSVLVFIKGSSNMFTMFALWITYHSIVNIGQRWYSFGWESQLLESGFVAIFFVPLFNLKQFPENSPPSWVVIWANKWLIFRIMLGAGLIKIRGDQCWRDLTCMEYHYQTQPVPNPISYYLHQTPTIVHKFETLSNHFIELIAPFLLLLPGKFCKVGGALQILFQVILIISGNLSFLNWLTILPSIACFDDKSMSGLFSLTTVKRVCRIQTLTTESKRRINWGKEIRTVLNYCLLLLIGVLSIPVVQNLCSSRQAMNTSFDSFRIVNTYGAFGSVTKTRTEVIIQGTRDRALLPDTVWEEYEFHCKPGDVTRRPCLISPYHYRLDWLMWFAAFMNYQQNPWLIHLAAKLLINDGNVTSLISYNPFGTGKPPTFIRGQHYEYTYTKIGSGSANWWNRKLIGEYFPAVDLHSLQPFLDAHKWKVSKSNK